MKTDINLGFINQSNDEDNSNPIIFKSVVNTKEPAKIKKISFNHLIIYLPDRDLADIEESLKNDKISFNELTINSLFKEVKYKLTTPRLDTEGMFPAEIKIIAVDCDEYRIEIITPEANLVTVVPSLVLEIFNTDGVKIMKVVDSQHCNQGVINLKHSVCFLKVENMAVSNMASHPESTNGAVIDIVKVGDNIANATKELLDAGYKLEHVVSLGNSKNNSDTDRYKYIFIKN